MGDESLTTIEKKMWEAILQSDKCTISSCPPRQDWKKHSKDENDWSFRKTP